MALFAFCFLLASCATKKVVEYRNRDVNHYITSVLHDTLINNERDSVYVDVFVKGDTVFKTRYKERLVKSERIITKRDTCWRDSIVVVREEITKENKKIHKIKNIAFGVCVLFIIFAILKLRR